MRVALLLALCLAAPTNAGDSWLAPDKAEHVAVSAGIGSFTYLVLRNDLGVAPAWKRALVAGGFTLAVGATKELAWDLGTRAGDASWRDFGADVVGTAAGVGLTYLVDSLLFPKPLAVAK